MADPAGWDPGLTTWFDLVEVSCRALGLADSAVVRLRRDLVVELAQARSGGAPVEELVRPDPALVAAGVAAADTDAGLTGPLTPGTRLEVPRTTHGLVLMAPAGADLGAALSLVTIYPFGHSLIDGLAATRAGEGAVALTLHVTAACMAAARRAGRDGQSMHWLQTPARQAPASVRQTST